MKFYLYEKVGGGGGDGKRFSHPEGGQKKFWSSFSWEA